MAKGAWTGISYGLKQMRPLSCAGLTLFLLAAYASCWRASASEPAEATMSGVVTTPDGKPLAGAVITARPLRDVNSARAAKQLGVRTGTDGSFRITGATGGKYSLCIQSPGKDALDPCEWSSTPPLVAVPDGATASNVQVMVAQGKPIRIRVEDPKHLVPTPLRPRSDTFLQFGVRTKDGTFHAAQLESSDARGHNYELLLPVEKDFEFVVDTYNLEVVDESAHKVKRNVGTPFRSDKATTEKVLRYRVTAAKP